MKALILPGIQPNLRPMKLVRFISTLILMPSLASVALAEAPPVFTKKMAQEKLASVGFKWRQTFNASEDAEAKLGQAEAARQIHVAGFTREFVAKTNPLVLGLVSSTPIDLIGVGVTGLEFEYAVYDRAAVARVHAAEANFKLGKVTTEQYQNDLRFLVLLRYLNAQQFRKKSEVVDLLLTKDSKMLKFAESRLKAGVGVPLDLARGEGLVERDHFKKLEAEANYKKSMRELAELIPDLNLNAPIEALEFREIPAEVLSRLESKALQRPEMRVAEYSLEAVRSMKEMADKETGMAVKFYGEVGTAGTEAFGLVHTPTGSLGVTLTIPLYTGGYQDAKSAEALSKLNAVDLQQQQVRLETIQQLESAKSQLEFTSQVVNSSKKQIELAEKELDYAERKIHLGSAGGLDALNAQTNLATALELNVQATFAYEAAKLSYFHLIADLEDYFAYDKKGAAHE